LTGAEIQSIILQCAQSNVREVDLPGLRLVFGEGGPAKAPATGPKAPKTTPPAEAALSDKQHEVAEKAALEQDEAAAKEERLSLMAIEDPAQFEELILRGELGDQEGNDGDDDGTG
jgi:hypothetical protein